MLLAFSMACDQIVSLRAAAMKSWPSHVRFTGYRPAGRQKSHIRHFHQPRLAQQPNMISDLIRRIARHGVILWSESPRVVCHLEQKVSN
jgi:hypothetical protein